MSKLFTLLLSISTLVSTSFAQMTKVEPSLSERPSKPFTNKIADGTAWVVTILTPTEARARAEKTTPKKDPRTEAADAKLASSTVKQISNAFASGLRKETHHFADGSRFVRYITKGKVLYEDRKTGKPVIETPDATTSGTVTGVGQMDELGWVSEKDYAGMANYEGRPCYVYRPFAREASNSHNEKDDESSAQISETVFVDKKTMRPVASESLYGLRYYEFVPFAPFTLPDSLQKELQRQLAEEALHKQKFQIRQ